MGSEELADDLRRRVLGGRAAVELVFIDGERWPRCRVVEVGRTALAVEYNGRKSLIPWGAIKYVVYEVEAPATEYDLG